MKIIVFYRKSEISEKYNDSRGLENAAVAATRVVEGPARRSLNVVQKRRCLQNVCENLFLFMRFWANSGGLPG